MRGYFGPDLQIFAPSSFDAIFSVSVLEHLSLLTLPQSVFGPSNHSSSPWARRFIASISCWRASPGITTSPMPGTSSGIRPGRRIGFWNPGFRESVGTAERRTPKHSSSPPQGHHHWRGGRLYDEFPFRTKSFRLKRSRFCPNALNLRSASTDSTQPVALRVFGRARLCRAAKAAHRTRSTSPCELDSLGRILISATTRQGLDLPSL